MANYKYKKGHDLTVVWIKKDKYTLCNCSQAQLERIYESGNNLVEKVKETTKATEFKKSVDEQGK